MENAIVLIIVGLAAFFIGRRFYRSYKAMTSESSNACGCGCSDGCSQAATCELPEAQKDA